jgi:hypothetical protein
VIVKAKRISPGCCNIVEGQIYEGALTNKFYFNPLVFGEYQGDHWIEGHWEILNMTTEQKPHETGGPIEISINFKEVKHEEFTGEEIYFLVQTLQISSEEKFIPLSLHQASVDSALVQAHKRIKELEAALEHENKCFEYKEAQYQERVDTARKLRVERDELRDFVAEWLSYHTEQVEKSGGVGSLKMSELLFKGSAVLAKWEEN